MPAGALFLGLFAGLSAFDSLYFHIKKERLTSRPETRREALLHAAGNALVCILCVLFAFVSFGGFLVLIPCTLVLAETAAAVLDYFEEKRVRTPGPLETAAHYAMILLHTLFVIFMGLDFWRTGTTPAQTAAGQVFLLVSGAAAGLSALAELRVQRPQS